MFELPVKDGLEIPGPSISSLLVGMVGLQAKHGRLTTSSPGQRRPRAVPGDKCGC